MADELEQLPPGAGTWDRFAFERSLRYSGLHPLARLVGFMLAHFAERAPNTGTGRIPATHLPELKRLATAAGIEERKARSSLNALEHGGWIIRHRYAVPHRAAITLTIPAGQPQPRAR